MSFDTGIYKLLTQDAAVSALVGTRVYPTEIPEGASWPAIEYSRPETQREPTMKTAGVPRARLLIGCYGQMPPDVISLAADVVNVLSEYSGPADDVTILASNYVDSRDGWDYEKSETGLYFRELSFDIFYRD